MEPSSDDLISEDDKAFFEDNPERNFRLRKPIGSEIVMNGKDNGPDAIVLVIKVHPEMRMRFPLVWSNPLTADELTRINTDEYGKKAVNFLSKCKQFPAGLRNSLKNLDKFKADIKNAIDRK